MTTKVQEQASTERETAEHLRREIEAFVARKGISNAELAARLGLVTAGAENLRGRSWSLETAWRVAEALGLRINVQVQAE